METLGAVTGGHKVVTPELTDKQEQVDLRPMGAILEHISRLRGKQP